MDCDKTEQSLLYLWGEMSASESAAFAEHLNQCPACKAEVEQLEPLVRSMQSLESEQLPDDLAQRIRTRLSSSAQAHPRRLRITPRRSLAVAASILLILGLGVMWRLMLNETQPSTNSAGEYAADTLTDQDYVEALALVWISESDYAQGVSNDSEDSLTAEIEDAAANIEYLLQEVDDTLVPTESDQEPNGAKGSHWQTVDRNVSA